MRGEIACDYDEYVAKSPEQRVLTVTGGREGKAEGIQDLVTAIMVDVLKEIDPECRQFYPLE